MDGPTELVDLLLMFMLLPAIVVLAFAVLTGRAERIESVKYMAVIAEWDEQEPSDTADPQQTTRREAG